MTDTLTLRRQLVANGYSPLPNIGKACYLSGWPTIEATDETLVNWSRRHKRFADTGLRVENGLAVIDLDINHEVIDDVAKAIEAQFPGLADAPIRYGKGDKEAWFVRTDEPFTRLHTRRWLAPGSDIEVDGAHVVEVFGGASPRQFGAFGAHTRDDGGEILIEYEWASDGGSPATRPLSSLPLLTKADFIAIVDLAEQVLEASGFTPVLRSVKGESEATRVFDITDDHRFECNDAVTRTLAELEQAAGSEGLRCSASWLEPGAGHSLTRCIVGLTHNGQLTVWDAATGVSHMRADLAPVAHEQRQANADEIAARLRRLAEIEDEKKTKRRNKISGEDDHEQVAGKLIETYAYCKGRQLPIVPVWTDTITDGYSMTNFRAEMQPHCGVELGPRGGEKKINPVDIWMSSKRRLSVEGLQLRPDMPRPLFSDERGRKWVNTYTPSIHDAEGGDITIGLEFMESLLPDPIERAWFLQWLAFKYRNPHIPGPAVVMVARAHGTGRGTLGELMRRLFGGGYVRTLGFDTFAGRTYQSQYNDWGADSLMVLVNESSTSDGGSIYKAKHDTYERLKELVDPRPIVRHFVVKGEKAFYAPGFTSFLISTNNPDALPLPHDDRRFWVGTNGEPRPVEFWERVNAWMEQPANVAAFAAMLDGLDLSDYSPFACPPMTDGKRAMSSMSESDVDKGFELAVANLPGQVVVVEQIIHLMRAAADTYGFDYPDKWQPIVKRMVASKLYRIGVPKGANWFPQIEGKRYAAYAADPKTASKWTNSDAQDLRVEILRSGSPSSSGLPGNVAAGLFRLAEMQRTKD